MDKIINLLQSKYGGHSHYLIYGDTIEFFFLLVNKNKEQELKNELEPFGGRKLCRLCF